MIGFFARLISFGPPSSSSTASSPFLPPSFPHPHLPSFAFPASPPSPRPHFHLPLPLSFIPLPLVAVTARGVAAWALHNVATTIVRGRATRGGTTPARVPDPAWHRLCRKQRANAGLLLRLGAAADLLGRHHNNRNMANRDRTASGLHTPTWRCSDAKCGMETVSSR